MEAARASRRSVARIGTRAGRRTSCSSDHLGRCRFVIWPFYTTDPGSPPARVFAWPSCGDTEVGHCARRRSCSWSTPFTYAAGARIALGASDLPVPDNWSRIPLSDVGLGEPHDVRSDAPCKVRVRATIRE